MVRSRIQISPARTAAFDALERVTCKGSYAAPLIAAFPSTGLSREDLALAQEIVLGVLRWRRTLDYIIEKHSNRTVDRIDVAPLISLWIGIYQIKYLTRVPDSAAVNESVNLVKRAGAGKAAGFVNALLRKVAADGKDQIEIEVANIPDKLERDSIRLSHPSWLFERWLSWLGEAEASELALANNRPAPTAFRVNTLRANVGEVLSELQSLGVAVDASALGPGIYIAVRGAGRLAGSLAATGRTYIQDAASQLVPLLVDPKPGDFLLDLCAAPGSKTTQLAALAANRCFIVAGDRHHHRLMTLVNASRVLGVSAVAPIAFDASKTIPFTGETEFDRVLVDAPCSGTGTLRQNPEIKWRLAPDDLPRLGKLQLKLLSNAASLVKSGGRVVYSTCSLEPEEGEQVIGSFLEARPDFCKVTPSVNGDLITPEGFIRTFPHRHNTDGFFAAILEKRS